MSAVLNEFEGTMTALDKMIAMLEKNLKKTPSKSPFDDIKAKYAPKPEKKEKPAEEKKAGDATPAAGKKDKKQKEKKEKKPAQPVVEVPALPDELEWWNTCDLRVGKIMKCDIVPDSEKLYLEQIDVGEEKLRQIGSGVRKCIPVEEMTKDALCLVFSNLAAKKLAGIPSQGMVMCASSEDKSKIELVRPPAGSKIGERVTISGFPDLDKVFTQDAQPDLKKKKTKFLEHLIGLTKTNDKCEACYHGIPMKTSAGVLTVPSLANSGIS